MRQIRLPGTELDVSQLGFGCASLMGNLGEKYSMQLLATALDEGITHFDTARLYGYGEAEQVLGRFLAGRRNHVTIATKFGIAPPSQLLSSGLVKKAARRIAALAPGLRPLLRRGAETMSRHGMFDVPSAKSSLEKSLIALRTDYVDLLLLHECTPDEYRKDDLQRFLEDTRRAGKTRYTGVATTASVVMDILGCHEPKTEIVQFPTDPIENTLSIVLNKHPGGVFVHSVLGRYFHHAVNRVKFPWQSSEGNIRLADKQAIANLLIGYAMLANSRGGVLFSSRDPVRIRRNVQGANGVAQYPVAEVRAAVLELCSED